MNVCCPRLKSPLNNINSLSLSVSASGQHRSRSGAVCQAWCFEWRECLHVCQVSCTPIFLRSLYTIQTKHIRAGQSSSRSGKQPLRTHLHLWRLCSALVVSFLALDVRRKFQLLSGSQFTEHQMCWHCHLNDSPTSVEGKLPRYQPTHATATQTGL